MFMEISIRQADAADFQSIRQLYQEWGYKGGPRPEDQIFVATCQGQLIGVVRISFESGYHVLRGMYVRAAFQHRGIGLLLLRKTSDWLQQQECFCVPFTRLRRFYGQIGFEEIKDAQAPGFLMERSKIYKKDGHDVIIMHRKGA
jgi:N-acetylglutamate synthase-like GNAT family acetyltransferase